MPRASTRAPAPPPAAAQFPAAQFPAAIIRGRPGAPAIPIPRSAAEVGALRDRFSELNAQRNSVSSQRGLLATQLRSAP